MQFNVSASSIRNPIPSVLLFIMLTIVGLMSFRAMKIQQFPDVELPTIIVSASLPGAAPAQMETEVARRIENSIASIQGLKHMYTKVQDGAATITAEFRLEKPIQEALDEVRDAVQRVRSDLPADLRDPVITKLDLAAMPILAYTVASSRMDDEALSWFIDNQVTKAVLAVRGVGGVSRVGGVTREIRVELDPPSCRRSAPPRPTSRVSCAVCSRRLRAAAPTSAAPNNRCAPSPPSGRRRSSPRWRSRGSRPAASARAARPARPRDRHRRRAARARRCSTASPWWLRGRAFARRRRGGSARRRARRDRQAAHRSPRRGGDRGF